MTCTCVDCFVNKAKSFIEEIEQMEDYGVGVNTYFKNITDALIEMKENIENKVKKISYDLLVNNTNIRAYLEMIINWCNGWEEAPVEWIEMNKDRTGKISYIVGDIYKRFTKLNTTYADWVDKDDENDEDGEYSTRYEEEAYTIMREEPEASFIADYMEEYLVMELGNRGYILDFAHHFEKSIYMIDINPRLWRNRQSRYRNSN